MKGIVLAGGLGTRLKPLTDVTNKHLLPIYDKPMVFYPIKTLLDHGIDEIMVVTGGEHAGDFLKVLKNGKELGIRHLEYAYQEGHGGIADALRLAREFVGDDHMMVALGDNIFGRLTSPKLVVGAGSGPTSATIYLKHVARPQRFGVPRFDEGRVNLIEIVEKPLEPPSEFAVTGLYCYPPDVFDVCDELTPSARDELEITDVNNHYIREGRMFARDIGDTEWVDAGTFEDLFKANLMVWNRKHR